MRRALLGTTLLLAGAIVACAGGQAMSPPTAGMSLESPSRVTDIRVARMRSTWETGPDYEATLFRGLPGRYKGVQEVRWIGPHTAVLSVAVFDSLAAYLASLPLLSTNDSTDEHLSATKSPGIGRFLGCNDAPGEQVAITIGGERRTLTDWCVNSTFIDAYVAPVERVVVSLDWRPVRPR